MVCMVVVALYQDKDRLKKMRHIILWDVLHHVAFCPIAKVGENTTFRACHV